MDVFPDGSHGKFAVTHYKVLERFNYVTLVECRLETGRTHQIRVHMKHIGHPLFNDETYGGNRILKGTVFTKYRQFVQNCFLLIPRQALHAYILGFNHPILNKEVLFESQLPDDMNLAIEKGGSSNHTYVNAEGKKGSYMDFARVFRREGLPCPRCGTTIIKFKAAGRGTHTCPYCQVFDKTT